MIEGRSYNEGRVEIYYNGVWGTICDDGYSSINTAVICKQLGFGSSGRHYSGAYFGQGSGPIWIDYLGCTGYETLLINCTHLGFNVSRSCSHSEDIGVRCYGTQGMYMHTVNDKS